ncbi:MAG: hypothetical protein HC853_01935 [Anaerolineae bacterium]|nr:hypothetical protein [Anaerolineae bacterium]
MLISISGALAAYSTLLIFLTEIAALTWHRISKSLARGETQHSIASAMTWVSLGGVVIMAGVEIGLEFAAKGASLDDNLVSTLSIVGLVVLIALMGANLTAGIAFQNADPDHVQRRNEEKLDEAAQSVQNELNEKTVEAVRRQMYERKDELMNPRINAILGAMMDKQHLLAKMDARRLLADTNGQVGIVDGTARPVGQPAMRFAKDDGEEGSDIPK